VFHLELVEEDVLLKYLDVLVAMLGLLEELSLAKIVAEEVEKAVGGLEAHGPACRNNFVVANEVDRITLFNAVLDAVLGGGAGDGDRDLWSGAGGARRAGGRTKGLGGAFGAIFTAYLQVLLLEELF
jgi:hypothetical protein